LQASCRPALRIVAAIKVCMYGLAMPHPVSFCKNKATARTIKLQSTGLSAP
jgi:hypothetical protein